MNISMNIAHISLFVIAFFGNIPLGYLRMGVPKYSLHWLVYIHLSVPFIIILRIVNDIHWHAIPFSILLAVLGQMVGSRIYRRSKT